MRTRTIALVTATLLVLVVGLTVVLWRGLSAQNVVAMDNLQLHASRGVFLHDGTPFTGTARLVSPAGDELEVAAFQAGKRHGTRRQYYSNGRVSQESQYVDGRLDGLARTWFETGVLRSEATWEQGMTHGVQRQWYASGALFKEMHLVHGREEGLQRAWRENGAIYNNYEAHDGRIYGLRRSKLCFELDEEEVVGDP